MQGGLTANWPLDMYGTWNANLCPRRNGGEVYGDGHVRNGISGAYFTFTRTDAPPEPGETTQVRLNTEVWVAGTALITQPDPPQGTTGRFTFSAEVSFGGATTYSNQIAGIEGQPAQMNIDTGWISYTPPFLTVPLGQPVPLSVSVTLGCGVRASTTAFTEQQMLTWSTLRCRLADPPFTFSGPGQYTVDAPELLIVDNAWPVLCPTCPGDMNGDTRRDGLDVSSFLGCVVLGGACNCANLDGMPGVDAGDVAVFVDTLLLGGNCP